MRPSRRISSWALLLAMVGCGDKSDDGTGSSTGSGTTSSATDTGTTETGTTTGNTGSGTTTTEDAGTTTTGQSDTGPPSVCDLACEVFFECDDAYASVEECVPGCEQQFEPGEQAEEPPCRDATEAWLLCIAELDCDQYTEWQDGDIDDPADYPCKDEDIAVRDACF